MSRSKYLGCAVTYKSEYDIGKKINKFRNIYSTILRNLRSKTMQITKSKFYKTTATATLIYANDAWVMMNKERGKFQRDEMQFLSNTINCTLQDGRSDLRAELEVNYINATVTTNKDNGVIIWKG